MNPAAPQLFTLTLALVASAHADVTLTNLGVPEGGGWVRSSATSVSIDGSVIVGELSSSAEITVFRWTASTGLQPFLLTLPGEVDRGARVDMDGTTVTVTSAGFSSAAPFSGYKWSVEQGLVQMPNLPPAYGQWDGNRALDISADGTTVVGEQILESLAGRPVRWTLSGVEDIGGTFGIWSVATAVNADGSSIVGNRFFHTSSGPPYVDQHYRAARFGVGDPQPLAVLHSSNPRSEAADLSADGSIICGSAGGVCGGSRAVRWWTWGCCEVAEDLGVVAGWPNSPGSCPSYSAKSISADGRIIVGDAGTSPVSGSWEYMAFVWTSALGMVDLNALLKAQGVDMGDTVLVTANAISGDGTCIIGKGQFSGVERAYAVHGLHLVPDPCPADITGNGGVDAVDLAVILGQWATDGQGEFDADVNDDLLVDGLDLAALLGAWGPCP